MVALRSVALPTAGDTSWHDWATAIDKDVRSLTAGIFLWDSYTGTDTQKWTAAIADQVATQSTYNNGAIVLPSRDISDNALRTLYDGCNIQGQLGGKIPERDGGVHEATNISLGATITSGASAWWTGSGEIYGVTMTDFSVQGTWTSTVANQQAFMDVVSTGGTLYLCKFYNLAFNSMRAVFGRKDRLMGFTGVILDGVWTMNNLWDTQMHVGGSDSQLWMGGWVNVGPSSQATQTGTYADGDYEIMFTNLSKTSVGYIFMTALNGWRGLRVQGQNTSLSFFGGTWEGFKPSRIDGLLAGPAPGTVIRIDTGSVSLFGVNIGQFMDNPDAAENGGVQINGGEVLISGCHFYGDNTDTVNSVQHVAGRLTVHGCNWMHRTGLVHAGRPKVHSTAVEASQQNLTTTYTIEYDHSIEILPARSYVTIRMYKKAGTLVANDFASGLIVGDLGMDTSTGKLYIATAANGTTTSTWQQVGTQT